jgi:hypothetical protein
VIKYDIVTGISWLIILKINECCRKSRKFGVEPGPVPHCPHWASHEVSKKGAGYNKRRSPCLNSWTIVQPGPCLI